MISAIGNCVPQKVLTTFNIKDAKVRPFGSGLINRTWKVCTPQGNYILQKINDKVFTQPQDIAFNTRMIGEYLGKNHPDYFFISPITTGTGDDMIFCEGEGWFRLMPFAEGSFTFDVVQTAKQAYEAARQFGRFTKLLSGFDAKQLKITLPHFHDLGLRYGQFLQAVSNGNKVRIIESQNIINDVLYHKNIVDEYRDIVRNAQFKLRVTHHDTKISNVLFDENSNGLCVIDLDTVMPGYFISDIGDMMRTYLSPFSEEEKDFEKISVRNDFYLAIVEGYKDEMNDELSSTEKNYFLFAGKFMIYMQALRFLADYLNNDIYYAISYERHNLVRAINQVTLLQQLMQYEK